MSGITTITSKGQITIPKGIREKLNLRLRDRLLVTVQGDRISMIPIRMRPLSEMFGALPVEEAPADVHATRETRHQDLAKRVVENHE